MARNIRKSIAKTSAWTLCAIASQGYPAEVDATKHGTVPFRNLYEVEGDLGQRAAIGYMLRRIWTEVTGIGKSASHAQAVSMELDTLKERSFAATWLGHATVLVRAGNLWILIDPTFSETVGPVPGLGPRRLMPPAIPITDLPRIDVVLISHDHYDHLDRASVRRLAAQAGGPPRFFVGTGLSRWFRDNLGVVAQEFEWWESVSIGATKFVFTPAQHSSGRSVGSKNTNRWGGWVIESQERRFYFAGDTSYVPQLFNDIRAKLGFIHLAALPIGAYRPRLLMRYEHLDPDEAVQAHLALGARRSFAIHWGTFQLGEETSDEVLDDFASAVHKHSATGFSVVPAGSIVDIN